MGLDQAAIEGLRTMILAGGVRPLAVGDLRADEVTGLPWSGNPTHLRSVAAALQRAAQGLEDYLVVRAPGGQRVAKMRIDYTSEAGTGVFSQLATLGRGQPDAGGLAVARGCQGGRAGRRDRLPLRWPQLPGSVRAMVVAAFTDRRESQMASDLR